MKKKFKAWHPIKASYSIIIFIAQNVHQLQNFKIILQIIVVIISNQHGPNIQFWN